MEFIKNLPSFITDKYNALSTRSKYLTALSVFTMLLYLVSMPSTSGIYSVPVLGTIFTSSNLLLVTLLLVILAHTLRKVFFNYDANMFQKLYDKAVETSNGAGLFALSMSICFMSICFLIMAAARV